MVTMWKIYNLLTSLTLLTLLTIFINVTMLNYVHHDSRMAEDYVYSFLDMDGWLEN